MKDDNYIFHVHTYRCAHASEDSDEAYVLAAISLGAKSIVFTDHAPFPDDLFGNRMRSAQLQEYISSLKSLKSRFKTSTAYCRRTSYQRRNGILGIYAWTL